MPAVKGAGLTRLPTSLRRSAAVGARGEFLWSVVDFAVICRKDPMAL